MDFKPPRDLGTTTELSAAVEKLRRRIKIIASTAAVRAGDAERVAFDIRKRVERERNHRTCNNLIYAHGSNSEVGGYVALDDLSVCGLERHGAVYALQLARAAELCPQGNRGALLRIIFADPKFLAWCRREGARTRWEWAKRKRDEDTAAFQKRQEAGSSTSWCREPVSELQQYLIALIQARGGYPDPCLVSRGAAYDWIREKGGHPDFWAPPTTWPDFV